MTTNAGPEYFNAEKRYLDAKKLEDKLFYLEEMIRLAPKHKSSENMVAELRSRLKKLKEKAERAKKKSGGRKGIKKEGYQCVLVGLPNSGKSFLLSKLTNAQPKISEYGFATRFPEIGTMDYYGVKVQIVDMPSIGSEYFDVGIVNTADCLLIVIEKLDELERVEKNIERSRAKKIVVVNKSDLLNDNELRKLSERIKSKRIFGAVISAKTGFNIDVLKEMIFLGMNVIRVYTKEPGKEKSKEPIVLKKGATIRDVAESILKGFSLRVKETRLTGPSGKFPNQKVGLTHVLEDLDIVEFHTR
ncbi:MAG: GTPase [Nanoarchaeota archaeon]